MYVQIETSSKVVSPRFYRYLDEVPGNSTNVEKKEKKMPKSIWSDESHAQRRC